MKHSHILITLGVVLVIAAIMLVMFQHKNQVVSLVKQLAPNPAPKPGTSSTSSGKAVVANADYDNSNVSFPLMPGSTGKIIKMLQVAAGEPITGLWDSALTDALGGINGMDLNDFETAVTSLSDADLSLFPLKLGSDNHLVKDVQILVELDNVDGYWGEATDIYVQNVFGKRILYLPDYIQLINTVLGLNIPVSTSATAPYYNNPLWSD